MPIPVYTMTLEYFDEQLCEQIEERKSIGVRDDCWCEIDIRTATEKVKHIVRELMTKLPIHETFTNDGIQYRLNALEI